MKFQYKEQVGGFLTELSYVKQKITTGSPNNTVNGTVNGISRADLILRAIEHNDKISITKLTQQVSASRMTIIRDLNKLNAQKLISIVCPDKGGYWQIINPQESNEN